MDVMSINIHRMFEYLFCADESSSFLNLRFENDVKMYGTQTGRTYRHTRYRFENDVKMYGTQTRVQSRGIAIGFENDVKMYGTQTIHLSLMNENSLRMM